MSIDFSEHNYTAKQEVEASDSLNSAYKEFETACAVPEITSNITTLNGIIAEQKQLLNDMRQGLPIDDIFEDGWRGATYEAIRDGRGMLFSVFRYAMARPVRRSIRNLESTKDGEVCRLNMVMDFGSESNDTWIDL